MEAFYWYWLCNIKGITNKKIEALVEIFKNPQKVYEASEKELGTKKGITGITAKDIEQLIHSKKYWDLTGEYERLQDSGIRFIHMEDVRYPVKLKEIHNRPVSLYVKGNLPLEDTPVIAIIGARTCSGYGSSLARRFGKELAGYGVQIVSGLARGIDGIAQRGALEGGGSSFGVLGCGVDICYPRENISLYMDIQKSGGLISEYPPGTIPHPYQFPLRNRIISGFADAIVVIEAKEKSGSLITADRGLEQGKEVFALPGRITDSLSMGCNRLIQQGAGMVLSTEDLLAELNLFYNKNRNISKKIKNTLENGENMVYSCLDLHPKCLNDILKEVSMSVPEVLSILLSLEIRGFIKEVSKNYYVKFDE